jgi:YVTN family beta-propeller protein
MKAFADASRKSQRTCVQLLILMVLVVIMVIPSSSFVGSVVANATSPAAVVEVSHSSAVAKLTQTLPTTASVPSSSQGKSVGSDLSRTSVTTAGASAQSEKSTVSPTVTGETSQSNVAPEAAPLASGSSMVPTPGGSEAQESQCAPECDADAGMTSLATEVPAASTVSPPVWEIGSVTSTITVGYSPIGVTYDGGNGNVYVANTNSNSVSVISAATNTVVATITVGNNPRCIAYDDENGNLYVSNIGGSSVSVISGATNTVVASIGVGNNPDGVAYDSGNGDLYVGNNANSNVSVISGATNTVVATVGVGTNPLGVAYDSGNGDLYVVNFGASNVSVISGATNKVVANIGVGFDPWDDAFDSGNGYIYVVNTVDSNVSVISGTLNKVVANVGVGTNPYGVAYDSGNGDMYVSNRGSNNISVISGATNKVLPSGINVGNQPWGVGYDSANGNVYVSDSGGGTGNTVSVISTLLDVGVMGTYLRAMPQTGSLAGGPMGAGVFPRFAVYDADNGNIYVTNSNSNNVTVISGATNTAVAAVGVGSEPWGAVYDSDNGCIYVVMTGGNYVSVISGATNKVVAIVGVGTAPIGIGYDSENGYVYVPNYSSNNVTVISGVTNKVVTSIGVGTSPIAIAFDSGNGELYVANYGSNNASVISGVTDKVVASVGVGVAPDGVGYDGCNGDLYVINWNQDNVSVISGASNKVVTNIAVGIQPRSAAFDSANGYMYLTNEQTSNVSVISGATNKVVATIVVGNAPMGVAYDTMNGEVYVTNDGADNVYAISTLGLASSTSSFTEDIGQPLLLSASLVGRGNGMIAISTTVTPSSGLNCVADPPDYSLVTVACTASLAGSYAVSVNVQDMVGGAVQDTFSISVLSDPAVGTPSASSTSADIGQSVTFTSATPSGGYGSYAYAWSGLPPGCYNSGVATNTCDPSAMATASVAVTVSDSNGYAVTSSTLTFMVYSDPVAMTPGSNVTAADVGWGVAQFTTFSAGGSGGNSYAWTGLPTGCASVSAFTIPCTPTGTGTFSLSVTVKDSNGFSVTSGALAFTVYSDPTVGAPTANVTSVDLGRSVTFTSATPSGGDPGYTYAWSGLPGGCSSTSASFSCTPTATGPYSITVKVKDSSNYPYPVTSSVLSFTVHSDPTVTTPTPSASSVDVGQSVTISTTAGGGTGVYTTYTWAVTSNPASYMGCTLANSASITCIPTSPTAGWVTVYVTDSNGCSSGTAGGCAPVASAVASVDVDSALTMGAPTANVSSLDSGWGSVMFTSGTQSGGSGTIATYTWNGLPPGCSSVSISFSCTPTGSGTFSITLTAVDTNGYSVTSSALSFTVYSDPSVTGAPTASATAMDVGQSVTFTSPSPSGGSGDFTYKWTNLPTGCSSSGDVTDICTPTGSGTFSSVEVSATDSNGYTSAPSSAAPSLTVDKDPLVSTPSPSPTSADVGQPGSVTFSTTASLGSLSYPTYAWAGLPAGCSGTTTATVSCAGSVFTTPTSYSITVKVTDSYGATSAPSSAVIFTVYADPQVSTPDSNRTSADTGQVAGFTTTASLGTGTYSTYSWSGLPAAGCTGTTTSTVSCTISVASATKYTVIVKVTDSNGETSASSGPLTFWAYPDPAVTSAPSPSRSSADVRQTVTFTATASAGTGSYSTYAWSGLPASGCSGIATPAVVCIFGSTATLSIYVTATDSNGVTSVPSPTLPYTVYADPGAATPTPSSTSAEVGQSGSVTFSTTATLGTTSYSSYAWSGLPAGCTGATTATASCAGSVFTTATTYTISVTVTDSNGVTSDPSGALTFTVYADPQVSTPFANRTSADSGQVAGFATTASLGTGTYSTYTWSGLPSAGCTGTTTSTVSCTLNVGIATGYTISVKVTDSNGETSASSGMLTFWAYPDPAVISAPTPSQSSADVGQTVTLTSTATGGSGSYPTYVWSGLPASGCTGVTTATVACTFGSAASLSIEVAVTDSNGMTSASSEALSFMVYADPIVGTPTASPTSADMGQTVTFTAVGSLGSGGYTYVWTVSPAGLGCIPSVTNTLKCVPTAAGNNYVVSVTVTDSNSNTSAKASSAAFSVYGDPTVTTPVATTASLDIGQSTSLSTIATPGSGSLSYYWTGLPAGCQTSNAATITCKPSAPGVYSVRVSVTDSSGANVTSDPVMLSISSAMHSVSLTASASTLDSGQVLVLDAAVNGGSGTYSYSWSHLPSGCASRDAPTLECTPMVSDITSETIYVNVTDSNSESVIGNVSLTMQPVLTVTLAANRTSAVIDAGSVVFTATVAGGAGPYTYTWTLNGSAVSNQGDQLVLETTHAGTYLVTVSVTDSTGVTMYGGATLLTVTSSASTSQTTVTQQSNSANGVEWLVLVLMIVTLVMLVVLISAVMGGKKKKSPPSGGVVKGEPQGQAPRPSPPAPAPPTPAPAAPTQPQQEAPPDWLEEK